MKKTFKQATVTLITAAILGSIIPMKSHAEEITKPISENTINQVNTQTSLTTPLVRQGRAVNINYPQMPKPNVEAFSNEDGTGTGYLDVSWEPVDGVTKYQVILFNGSIHSYWDVPANETTWTTKGKGMFPTKDQIEAGQVNFRRDGKGTELSVNPSNLYKKAYEVNGGSNYTDNFNYYVRVTAEHEDGASPISYATLSSIPQDKSLTVNLSASYVEHFTGTEDIVNSDISNEKNIVIVENQSGTISIPNTLNSRPITVVDESSNGEESLKISLPSVDEGNVVEAQKSNSGTIVYQNLSQPVDLFAQPTEEGFRSLITIKDNSAPHDYTFTFDIPNGGKLVTSAEYLGEVFDTGEVFIVDSNNEITSIFSPAWAKDANGNDVPTYYTVDGNKLTQTVEFNENTAFPVVADPDWMRITKCSAALATFVGSNLFAASKLLKVKQYIKSLGGLRKSAKLLLTASTAEERLRVGGQALLGLAAELTGAGAVYTACKK